MSMSSHKTSEERTCATQTSPTSIVLPSIGPVVVLTFILHPLESCVKVEYKRHTSRDSGHNRSRSKSCALAKRKAARHIPYENGQTRDLLTAARLILRSTTSPQIDPPLYSIKRTAHPLTWLELAFKPAFTDMVFCRNLAFNNFFR
jgi:hypothetical protein